MNLEFVSVKCSVSRPIFVFQMSNDECFRWITQNMSLSNEELCVNMVNTKTYSTNPCSQTKPTKS